MTKMLYYAGIGSRETPERILNSFEQLGETLGKMGYVLRSGRAPGADTYFEKGAIKAQAVTEIYVPWRNFPRGSDLNQHPAIEFDKMDKDWQANAYMSVYRFHPAPLRLSDSAKKFLARDYCQIFGKNNQDKISSFVVCYTKDGQASGGTGQAIRIAQDARIPVFNAFGYEHRPDEFVTIVTDYAQKIIT